MTDQVGHLFGEGLGGRSGSVRILWCLVTEIFSKIGSNTRDDISVMYVLRIDENSGAMFLVDTDLSSGDQPAYVREELDPWLYSACSSNLKIQNALPLGYVDAGRYRRNAPAEPHRIINHIVVPIEMSEYKIAGSLARSGPLGPIRVE